MNDTFLPGNGFDTYEQQDRVLIGMNSSLRTRVAVRILQQQGFAVVGAVVRLTPDEEPVVQAAKQTAKALDIECVTLNAEALASQDAADARLSALLTAADKLGIQYIATGHYARVETGSDGASHIFPHGDAAVDESDALAVLPQEILARLILPLGEFSPADVDELATEFKA